jgi:hypothetical protein
MYTQFNSRINVVYATRWHYDAGFDAIATYTTSPSFFVVTVKATGESVKVQTLREVNAFILDRMDLTSISESQQLTQ